METVLEHIQKGEAVRRISTDQVFTVTEIPMWPTIHGTPQTPKSYFYGTDRHGNVHMLSYADCAPAYPWECTCGEVYAFGHQLTTHLNEAWDADDVTEANRHNAI